MGHHGSRAIPCRAARARTEESDTFIAELRSELPEEWAARAEAIYCRHLND